MDHFNKDSYFEQRDQLIKRLPEPEKSVFRYFREVEESNLRQYGRLTVHQRTPIMITAEHFMMTEEETKQICLSASNKLKVLFRNKWEN
ncbi:hypothetical protein ACM26V_05870 [Salipaludibacillus sp. HK11]|uniref:hypothetical protein n=1 Tax=Salipaludibacillus sp. HK11 TaxID=3394320 RepID=UPI0039FDA9A7